jgi:CBS domain-containing protein
MNTVAEILRAKGTMVHQVARDASAHEAIAKMVEHNVGSLLVVDDRAQACGIITERDCLRGVTLSGRDPQQTTVWEIATRQLITVGLWTSLDECRALMTHCRIRHLPVVDRGVVRGIISIGDVVKHQLDAQADDLQHLIEYIRGEFSAVYSIFSNRDVHEVTRTD